MLSGHVLSHIISPDQLVAHRTFHWVVGNWETAFNGLNLLLVQRMPTENTLVPQNPLFLAF